MLNILFSVFNSLHSVTLIKYCASHDFIYNTLNIIKILFIAFKSNRKVCLRWINLRLNRHNHHLTPTLVVKAHLSSNCFEVRPNLARRYRSFPRKLNQILIFQLVLKKCKYPVSGSPFSTITRWALAIFLLNSYLTWARQLLTGKMKLRRESQVLRQAKFTD